MQLQISFISPFFKLQAKMLLLFWVSQHKFLISGNIGLFWYGEEKKKKTSAEPMPRNVVQNLYEIKGVTLVSYCIHILQPAFKHPIDPLP